MSCDRELYIKIQHKYKNYVKDANFKPSIVNLLQRHCKELRSRRAATPKVFYTGYDISREGELVAISPPDKDHWTPRVQSDGITSKYPWVFISYEQNNESFTEASVRTAISCDFDDLLMSETELNKAVCLSEALEVIPEGLKYEKDNKPLIIIGIYQVLEQFWKDTSPVDTDYPSPNVIKKELMGTLGLPKYQADTAASIICPDYAMRKSERRIASGPKASYVSSDFKCLVAAWNKFWLNADLKDITTYPCTHEIALYLYQEGRYAKNVAVYATGLLTPRNSQKHKKVDQNTFDAYLEELELI